jgi:hypothetical protein
MGQQIFDDGSSLSVTTTESGGEIISSTYATDVRDPRPYGSAPTGQSGSGLFSGIGNLLNLFSPSQSRLSATNGGRGLLPGGQTSNMQQGVSPNTIVNTAATTARAKDWRVSVTLANPALFGIQKGNSAAIQSVLAEYGGVIFPYIPQISVQHNARYSEQQLTHSNYKNYFYDGSDVNAITISGEFTVQNIAEGQYLMAAIYFFRSATKMFFGGQANTGNPPPLVKLNGYGPAYFPDVNCVVTQFSHTMGSDVDYMEIPLAGASASSSVPSSVGKNTVRLPTVSTISVTVQPVYSRKTVHDRFDLTKFARGELLTNGFL